MEIQDLFNKLYEIKKAKYPEGVDPELDKELKNETINEIAAHLYFYAHSKEMERTKKDVI